MASFTKPDPEPQTPGSGVGDIYAAERAELDAVLQSEGFRRSPKVSRLLSYLCRKYFEGQGEGISEYGIAIEVLGRDTDFDPQTDAIVRVDAHHLRKRLKSFYETQGKDHEIEIVIPSGNYTPKFVHRLEVLSGEPAAGKPGGRSWRRTGVWMGGLAAVAAIAALLLAMPRPKAAGLRAAFPGGEEVRILAGDRGEYTDKAGRVWLADRFFTGGSTFRRAHQIRRTLDAEIFQGGREGQFAYEIPLKPGDYELRLYFADTGVATENQRGVTVAINGISRPTVDIVSDAGAPDAATVKIVEGVAPAKDGVLHLSFQGNPAFVNAVELLPGTQGPGGQETMRPIRIRASETPFRDHLGRIWSPDEWFEGGRVSARSDRIAGADDPDLFLSQRYGHFTYSIPVLEAQRYTITLYFSETWFGKPAGGVGSRVFDVYCNGTTLLKNFDILRETGGEAGRGVIRTFRNVESSPQGKLELTFLPVVNYATVSAIEVVQE